jgi:hypothetical protein
MSDVFDDIIEREGSPADAARIAAVIKAEPRFECFGKAAFATRLLRLDQKLADGVAMTRKKMSNILNVKPELLQEFCGHLTKPGARRRLYADGRAVEIPVF